MRWLVLDEILEIHPGRSVRAKSRVPEGEFSPEVLMLEMMAQAGGVLLGAESDFQQNVVFSKIEAAEFSGHYDAGESIEISATSDQLRPEGGWIETTITNFQGTIAKAKIMLASVEKLVPDVNHSITFHQEFMNHFQIREKLK